MIIARAVSNGELQLGGGADPAQTIAALCAIRGIGPWTAHYIAMQALAWPDAWPPAGRGAAQCHEFSQYRKGQARGGRRHCRSMATVAQLRGAAHLAAAGKAGS